MTNFQRRVATNTPTYNYTNYCRYNHTTTRKQARRRRSTRSQDHHRTAMRTEHHAGYDCKTCDRDNRSKRRNQRPPQRWRCSHGQDPRTPGHAPLRRTPHGDFPRRHFPSYNRLQEPTRGDVQSHRWESPASSGYGSDSLHLLILGMEAASTTHTHTIHPTDHLKHTALEVPRGCAGQKQQPSPPRGQ